MEKLYVLVACYIHLQSFGVISLKHETYIISSFVSSALAFEFEIPHFSIPHESESFYEPSFTGSNIRGLDFNEVQWKSYPKEVLKKKTFTLSFIHNKEVFEDISLSLSNNIKNSVAVDENSKSNDDEYVRINLASYKDDENNDHIATWNIKIINSTSNTTKNQINYTITDRELEKCHNNLRISNTTEPQLVYTCYLWSKEPHFVIWILISFFILIYFIIPVFIANIYIRSIKTSTRTGFLKMAGSSFTLKKNMMPSGGAAFIILAVICVITTILFIGSCIFFICVAFDQTSGLSTTSHIITMNNGIRVALTCLCCFFLFFLAFFKPYYSTSAILTPCNFWYSKVAIPLTKELAVVIPLIKILAGLLGLFYLLFSLLLLTTYILLNISFLLFHATPFFISDMFIHFIIFLHSFGCKKLNFTHILPFAFLTQAEKTSWISKVNEYTKDISNRLHTNCFYTYITKKSALFVIVSKVSFLHTGSIPSQLGKPLMLLGDLPRVVSDSFPELCSDHDVMFSLDHLQVSEEQSCMVSEPGGCKKCNIFRITIQSDRPEFVHLHTHGDPATKRDFIKNTEASKFMVKVISETFFTPEGKMTEAARSIPALSDVSELCSCLTGSLYKDHSYKFLVERAGPSVNLKITLHRGHLIFDCDFLLSLPLTKWPSPAQEWLTRERKWPDASTIARLAALPCHIIPKPRSENDTQSWRFSFSNQELELTSSLPDKARLCYIGLKLIFKKYLKSICSELKSYHMLTMFLWFMEHQDPQCWDKESTMDNGENILLVNTLELGPRRVETKMMLEKLLLHVSITLHSGYLCHFFIRNVNLHPGNSKEMSKLVIRIEQIVHNGVDRLLGDKLILDVSILNPSLFQSLLKERLE